MADARDRLHAVQAAAEAEMAAARGRFGGFDTAVGRIVHDAGPTAERLAADIGTRLRRARRRWIRSGDHGALAGAIAAATAAYADAAETANRQTQQALHAEAERFGTQVTTAARVRSEPEITDLAPADRIERATNGRAQWLRRTLWRRWYLPGLARLESQGITKDLTARAAWVNATARAVREAASATLTTRLHEITERAEAQAEEIKVTTAFAANEAEFAQLSQDMPILAAQCDAAERINAEARPLL